MSEIFNNNGITLRSEKAAALSFNEMDQNFSSFFYSASAVRVNTTNKLRLFYTGSDTLDNGFEADRYMEVLLPDAASTTTTVGSSITIPGSANQIMFNTLNSSGESILGASGNFVFTNNSRVGIGLNDPNAPLTLKSTNTGIPSSVIIRANNSEDQVTNTRGYYEVNRGETVLFRLGKTTAGGSGEGADNTHLFSKNSIDIGQSDFVKAPVRKMRITSSGVIIGDCVKTNVYPASPLTVIGELSVGLQQAAAQLGYIGGIGECNLANLLPTNSETTGVLIQSPKGAKGGVVAIGLNTDASKCESFSVLRGCQGCFDSSIATFRADGKVGIGVTNPKELFHVEGNITGSGTLHIQGRITGRERLKMYEQADFCKTIAVYGQSGLVGGLVSYTTSIFDTNSNTTPVEFRRLSNDSSQKLRIGVTDTEAIFDYEEDTNEEGKGRFGSYKFKLSGNLGTDRTASTNSVACTPLTIAKEGLTIDGRITATGQINAQCFVMTDTENAECKLLKADGDTTTIGGEQTGAIITNGGIQCANGTHTNNLTCKYIYQKLSTGLIIQGGQYKTGVNNNTLTTIYFPVSFPNCAMAVNVTSIRNGSSSLGSNYVSSVNKSSFKAVTDASYGYFIAIGY